MLVATPVQEIQLLPLEGNGKIRLYVYHFVFKQTRLPSNAVDHFPVFFQLVFHQFQGAHFFTLWFFWNISHSISGSIFPSMFPKVTTDPAVDGVLLGLMKRDTTLILYMPWSRWVVIFSNSNGLVMIYVQLTPQIQHFVLTILSVIIQYSFWIFKVSLCICYNLKVYIYWTQYAWHFPKISTCIN